MIESNTVKDDRSAVLTWKKDYTYRALIYKLKDITLNNVSVQDFRIGIPGMLAQAAGGYLIINYLLRK